mmetsp:Transcript_5581/g.16648  ORF Transcript_5581/g.16648 Transcript_5581/m.16648 type:complete len:130 (+) Transcript_5581:87-476(+)
MAQAKRDSETSILNNSLYGESTTGTSDSSEPNDDTTVWGIRIDKDSRALTRSTRAMTRRLESNLEERVGPRYCSFQVWVNSVEKNELGNVEIETVAEDVEAMPMRKQSRWSLKGLSRFSRFTRRATRPF